MPREVTVTARDFAFEAPDTIPAGPTKFRLVNQGPDFHHIWLVRLEEGKTMADLNAELAKGGESFPSWIVSMGGPNTGLPGVETRATVDLPPGNYALLCVIPASDGVPHVAKGMVRPLTVVPSQPATAALPTATTELTLVDYGFEFSKPLAAGRQVVRIRNAAAQPHEVLFVQLAPGKSAADFLGFLQKAEGDPPGKPVGGITGIDSSAENTLEIDLEPGRYALICFVPDHKDGKPHFAHGMVQEITVS